MDASHLTVSPDTLRFQKMSPGKRTKLRRQNIIDLINSKPYGTAISLAEFTAAAQLKTTASSYSLIKTMLKHGIISRDVIDSRHMAYRVNGPVTTRQLARPAPVMPVPPPSTTRVRRPTFSQRLRQGFLLGNAQQRLARVCSLDGQARINVTEGGSA